LSCGTRREAISERTKALRQGAREAIGYAGPPGGRSIRLISRNGHNLAERFPLATAAIEELSIRSCVIDGETIALLPVCHDHSA
jgi:ATP-dependent DNA ligase